MTIEQIILQRADRMSGEAKKIMDDCPIIASVMFKLAADDYRLLGMEGMARQHDRLAN